MRRRTTQLSSGVIHTSRPTPLAEYPFSDGSGTTLTDIQAGANGTFGAELGAGYYPTWISKGCRFAGTQAIGVPNAALEGAQTLMWFGKPTLSNQTSAMAVLGVSVNDGNMLAGFTPGDNRPGMMLGTILGDVGFCSGQPIKGGTFGVTLRTDGKVFVNGSQVPWYAVPQHNVPPYPTFTNVSANRIGMFPFGAYTPYQGELYYLVTYPNLLTDYQISVEHARIAGILSARSITLSVDTSLVNTLLAWEGDSITRNYLASQAKLAYPQKTMSLLSGTYDFVNMSIGGSGSPDMLDRIAQQYSPLLHGQTAVLTLMIGTNENWGVTYNNLVTAYPILKSMGFTYIIAVTGLPRYAADTPRLIYNDQVRAGVGIMCDAVQDWAADLNMGQTGQYVSGTYYADQLHPNDTGHAIGGTIGHSTLVSLGFT